MIEEEFEDDDRHKNIVVTLLDTVTGQTAVVDDISPWSWSEGNWSCDCNRESYFDLSDEAEAPDNGYCQGAERFVVKSIDSKCCLGLSDMNQDYPRELLEAHGLPHKESWRSSIIWTPGQP